MGKQPESLDKITKARLAFSSIGSTFSIALTMFLVGLTAVIAIVTTQVARNISENLELEVLFFPSIPQQIGDTTINKEVSEADIRNYELTLKREPFVKTSVFHSRAENTEFTKEILRNDFDQYTDNPLNASITLTLNEEYTSQDSIDKVIQHIQQNEQVKEVTYPNTIADFIHNNLTSITFIILGICGVFLFISLLLIGNSIRLNIYAKRFNIRSMLLIGATRRFVRKPFITKGLVQGIIGGAIATGLVGLVVAFASRSNSSIFIPLQSHIIVASILGGVFCFSILFTTLIALIFTNRYIKINPDRLYL